MSIATQTEEERAAYLAQARVAQRAKQAARKASTLRKDFMDADHWLELANDRGLRLPPWGEPMTITSMRTWLHKANMSQTACEAWLGCKLAAFITLNSQWPLRSFAGLVLEQRKEVTK